MILEIESFSMTVYESKPHDFCPTVEVAATYVNVNGKILILQLASAKSEAGCWGVPAGKLERGEKPISGARRELFEETGIDLTSENMLRPLGELYIRKPDVDYVYHLFGLNLDSQPTITLSAEHCDFKWISRSEEKEQPLMQGAEQALETYYQKTPKKKRTGATINAHLILRKGDEVLLLLRKNTGHCDNLYGLVAGHVEDGESATAAIMREAFEEAGVELESQSIKVVHVMHRQTNRFNVDLFFEGVPQNDSIVNREPEKCGDLSFFSLNRLPSNTIEYIAMALKLISEGCFYSEKGWDND